MRTKNRGLLMGCISIWLTGCATVSYTDTGQEVLTEAPQTVESLYEKLRQKVGLLSESSRLLTMEPLVFEDLEVREDWGGYTVWHYPSGIAEPLRVETSLPVAFKTEHLDASTGLYLSVKLTNESNVSLSVVPEVYLNLSLEKEGVWLRPHGAFEWDEREGGVTPSLDASWIQDNHCDFLDTTLAVGEAITCYLTFSYAGPGVYQLVSETDAQKQLGFSQSIQLTDS